MIRFRFTAACSILLFAISLSAASSEAVLTEATTLREQGEFEKATRALTSFLDQNTTAVPADEKRTIQFEIERIRRIRDDYQLTRDQLLKQFTDRLTTFTAEELDEYERQGKLDVMLIDAQKFYVNSTASNLLFRVPELRQRVISRKPDTAYRRLYEAMLTAREAAKTTSGSLLAPQDFVVTASIVVDADSATAGKSIRCWLPFAQSAPQQADIALLASDPAPAAIAPPEYPHRTIYQERTAVAGQPTTFTATFVYRSWARHQALSPDTVRPYEKESADYAYYSAERKPHIDFSSEELKRIDAEISQGDANPLLQAKRIYDWISRNTIYQYAREYSTLENLSHYTAQRRAGDCGQHAMLFIALCRMKGIPARWATGWESFNDRGQNMHDWAEFYIEPYGWLPADPDMAVNIRQYATDNDELTTAQQDELADWLFGNMDHYRLTVNTDYSRPLFPEKTDFRSETVDFQRGEVEADGQNLYFDKWNYRVRIKPIPAAEAEAMRRALQPKPQKFPEPPKPTPAPTPAPTPTPTPAPAPEAPATTETVTAAAPTTATESVTTPPAAAAPTPEVTPAPTPTPAPVDPSAPVPTPTPAPTATPAPPADAPTTETKPRQPEESKSADPPTTATSDPATTTS